MKVAILCLSPGIGGLELYALREYMALKERGIDCIPIVAKGSKLALRFEEKRIKVYYLEIRNRKFPLICAYQLSALIQEFGAEVLHIHWAKDLVLAALAKKLGLFRLIYTRHMDITRSKKDWLHRFLYKEVDAFWTITKVMRKQTLDFLPISEDRVKMIYLGVAAPTQGNLPTELPYDDQYPRRQLNLGLFGRIEHGKGQHLLINAVDELVTQGVDISVTLIGHVMDADYLREIKDRVEQKGLSSRVRFVGFLEHPINAMNNFDVIVLATYKETFGLVLPEAMRAGIAVIGSNAGGVPEIIDTEETGLLFKTGDSESLAAAIKRYYEDEPFRALMAKNGQQKANQLFAEDRHFDAVVGHLESAVG